MEDPPAAAPAAVAVAPADPLVLLNARMTTNDARIREIEAEIKQLQRDNPGFFGKRRIQGDVARLMKEKDQLINQNTETLKLIAGAIAQAQPAPAQAQALPQGIIFFLSSCHYLFS